MSNGATSEKPSFQMKADFFPMTVLKLANADMSHFAQDLASKVQQAPKYFQHAPVVIDVSNVDDIENTLDIKQLCDTLRQQAILPVGLRGVPESAQEFVEQHGLVLMKNSKHQDKPEAKPAPEQTQPQASEPPPPPAAKKTMIVDRPVRAGTRIYAKGSDLIILAPVNSGAECIADGHIHIYAPLRGKALAGALGDTSARIFCESLEAELVSVAGHYCVKENIKVPKKSKAPMMQVYLENDKLQIEGI